MFPSVFTISLSVPTIYQHIHFVFFFVILYQTRNMSKGIFVALKYDFQFHFLLHSSLSVANLINILRS